MEMTLNNGFCEMTQDELNSTDGGFFITFTAGALIAGGLFLVGVVVGVAWACCD